MIKKNKNDRLVFRLKYFPLFTFIFVYGVCIDTVFYAMFFRNLYTVESFVGSLLIVASYALFFSLLFHYGCTITIDNKYIKGKTFWYTIYFMSFDKIERIGKVALGWYTYLLLKSREKRYAFWLPLFISEKETLLNCLEERIQNNEIKKAIQEYRVK